MPLGSARVGVLGSGVAIPDDLIGRYLTSELSLLDDDAVTQWPDESPESNDLTTADAPTYQTTAFDNGQPGVLFNGTSNYLVATTSAYDSPRTVIAAVKHNDSNDVFSVVFDGGTSNEHRSFVISDLGTPRVRLVSGSVDISDATDARDSESVFVFEVDGSNSRIRRNGATLVTGGDANDSSLTGFTVGVRGGADANFLDGYIGDLEIYDRLLTTNELFGRESFLSNKFGIPLA